MLASVEPVTSVRSVPRIHLSVLLATVTFLRQPERSFLIGIYPLALRNSDVMNRSESLVESYNLSATSRHKPQGRDLFK